MIVRKMALQATKEDAYHQARLAVKRCTKNQDGKYVSRWNLGTLNYQKFLFYFKEIAVQYYGSHAK